MKAVHQVLYNNGENEDLFALVVKDEEVGDTLLTLAVLSPTGQWETVTSIPRREKKDYGPEGGGKTWHTDEL